MTIFLTEAPPTILPDPWAYTLAAPYDWSDDPKEVTLWCADHTRSWWLVVDGKKERPLTDTEAAQAAIQAGWATPVKVDRSTFADLGVAPFDADYRVSDLGDVNNPTDPTKGRVLAFPLNLINTAG